MSAESEDPSTAEDSGCDGGSPAGSEEDGRLSPRSRKTPDGSRWSFSATFIVQFQTILSAEEVTTKSAEVFQHAFLDREEAKEFLGPRFVKYMLVLFDSCVFKVRNHTKTIVISTKSQFEDIWSARKPRSTNYTDGCRKS